MTSSRHFHLFHLFFIFLSLAAQLLAQTQCSSSVACKQGCCSKYGSCGFGPDFCGSGNCVNNCDAKAECGQYAPTGKFNCPLNVCCSQYGFCGTTTEFCDSKCQAGCAKPNRPSCGGSSADKRRIGYYESWTQDRPCDVWQPENIDARLWTHLNYAFALIDSSYKMASMNSYDPKLYPRVTGLKRQNPALKVFISVGGWDAGGQIFSKMTSTSANRQAFISSAITFMRTYAFDGIDIDWEYPVAGDRGGTTDDFANFATFMSELKAACGSKYGVTLTLPSSYWYLQGFDIKNLERSVDWFNFMSYDIHGTWDGNSPFTKAVVNPHTNLTEISDGLDLLWRNNINPGKVVLGLGFYGRSFTLKDSSCNKPGCAFSSGGLPGKCTKTSGVLSNAEIQRIIKDKSLTPVLDKTAGVKYIVWDSNQWVSYDDAETLKIKQDYANNLCLGGTMVWALDLDDPSGKGSLLNYNVEALKLLGDDVDKDREFGAMKARAIQQQNQVQLATFWTDCLKEPKCPPGFMMLTYGHGKIFDADSGTVTGDGCHGGWGGYNRALCVESSVYAGECKWFGSAPSCNQPCPKNWVQVSQNSHVGSNSCKSGAFKVYCCNGFVSYDIGLCPATNFNKLLSGGNAKRSAYDLEAQLGTKFECDYNLVYAAQSFTLLLGGVYILNHMPGMWVYGGLVNRYIWRPAENLAYKVQSAIRACTSTTTVLVEKTVVTDKPKTATCDFDRWPQACHHYSSVIQVDRNLQTIFCNVRPRGEKENRPATKVWNDQHQTTWRFWVPKGIRGTDSCDRDEYPPFHFLGTGNDLSNDYVQWIRWLPASQNRGAGSIWAGTCDKIKSSEVVQGGPVSNSICTELKTISYTVNALTMTFSSRRYQQPADDGIIDNPCYPTRLTNDPGFALFTHDVWYGRSPNRQYNSRAYKDPPSQALLNAAGNTPPRPYSGNSAKRWLHEPFDDRVHPNDIIVDDGNSTRKATDEELFKHHGLFRCTSKDCKKEYINGQQIEIPREPERREVEEQPGSEIPATATQPLILTHYTAAGSRPSAGSGSVPQQTGSAATSIEARHLHRYRHSHGRRHHLQVLVESPDN